jgi:DNA-binding MarR family transcriptional regulator
MITERGGFLVRRLNQIWSAQLQRKFREAGHDVTSVQFAALDMIVQNAGLAQTDIAMRIGHDRVTTGGMISRLEQAGYIVRQPDPNDRRARLLTATAKGRAAASELSLISAQTDKELLAHLDPTVRETLFSATKILVTEGNKLGIAPAFCETGRPEK